MSYPDPLPGSSGLGPGPQSPQGPGTPPPGPPATGDPGRHQGPSAPPVHAVGDRSGWHAAPVVAPASAPGHQGWHGGSSTAPAGQTGPTGTGWQGGAPGADGQPGPQYERWHRDAGSRATDNLGAWAFLAALVALLTGFPPLILVAGVLVVLSLVAGRRGTAGGSKKWVVLAIILIVLSIARFVAFLLMDDIVQMLIDPDGSWTDSLG